MKRNSKGSATRMIFSARCWKRLAKAAIFGCRLNSWRPWPSIRPSIRGTCFGPARLMLKDGATGDVLLPALYPGSHEHADDQIKLGRAVDWSTPVEGLVRGTGVKTFMIGDDAPTLLEWRELLIA